MSVQQVVAHVEAVIDFGEDENIEDTVMVEGQVHITTFFLPRYPTDVFFNPISDWRRFPPTTGSVFHQDIRMVAFSTKISN